MVRFIPRETKFFQMFAEMCANVMDGARLLTELLSDFQDLERRVHKLKDIEHRGDDLIHGLITKLNQTFITPFDREDIHKLASSIDDVLDLIDAAGERMLLYKIGNAPLEAVTLAKIIVEQCEQLSQAVIKLEKHNDVLPHCVEINRLENEADSVCRRAIGHLFDQERDPIRLIKLKELYEVLESATDKAEDAANVLESVMVKSA